MCDDDQPKKVLDGNVEFKFKIYEKSVIEVGGHKMHVYQEHVGAQAVIN